MYSVELIGGVRAWSWCRRRPNRAVAQEDLQHRHRVAAVRADEGRTWRVQAIGGRYRHGHGLSDVHVPNVVKRDFHATAPNQKWVTDITEFSVKGQKLYLSACMDLYNGEIIAHRMARRPVFDLVSRTLQAAFRRVEAAEGLVVHSDQGWQYKMPPYQAMLKRHRVTQSMSRKGDCFDNAVIESFFGTLKAEYFHLVKCDDLLQLKAGVHDYIRYYNNERIKLVLQRLSPVEYRLKI
jgi:putative transposase